MRIIDAEPQLVKDVLDEMEIVKSHKRGADTIYVGRHEMLGRMVVVSMGDDGGVIVEME